MVLRNKRGMIIWPVVMFIILNLIFFALILTFVYRASSGATIYEQAIAKEIVLILDKAEPYMEIELDISKGIEIAEKNKVEPNITIEKNVVRVSFSKGDYMFKTFSNYPVEIVVDKTKKIVIIKIGEIKNEE